LAQIESDLGEYLKTFPRQALHAGTLGFVHPLNGKHLSFAAPLPPDLAALQAVLRRIV
jgi:23S rRNA pseudouridine1911/1915/1917 synthase